MWSANPQNDEKSAMMDQNVTKNVADNASERKPTEETLRHERNRAQLCLDVAAIIMVVLDKDGKITLLNRKGSEVLQYPDKTLLGSNWFDTCIPERVRNGALVTFRQLMAGQLEPVEYFENPVVTRSGKERIIAWHSALLTDDEGNITGTLNSGTDITDRGRAEAALRESEERYRTLAESTTDVILIHDRNGAVLYGNPAGAAYIGIEPRSAIGKTQQELFSPEMIHKHTECLAEVFQTGQILETDGMYHLGGTDVWFNSRLIPLTDEHGQVTSVLSVSRNITDRKQAEEALKQAHDELERRVQERTAELTDANQQLQREVEERKAVEGILLHSRNELQTIYNEMVEGCSITDIETKRFVRVNSSFCQMLGYSEEELLATSVQDIHPPEEATNDLWRFQQVAESQRSINENRPVLRKDGAIFYADITGRRILYDGRPCVLALFRDVTERRHAQEALRESEEKYKTLVETSPDAVIMADLTGRATFVSRRYLEMHAAECADEFLGKTAFDFMVPEEYEKGREYFQKTLRDGITRGVEYTFIKKNGTRFPAELSAAVVKDCSGKPVAIVSILRDITERKQAEEALQRKHRTLKYLLQSSDHERQLIAYEIHDGLAQQLAGAIMQFQTYDHLKDKKPNPAAKAYDAGMTMLQQGHVEARRLISGVRPPILDEQGVIAAIAHLVHEQSRLKGPKIDNHSRVDFDRLAPILENAIYRIAQEGLANACQHSKSEKVRVSLVQRGDRIRIEVRDWGIGFNTKSVQENRFGLVGIRQRVGLLGGKCSIRSTMGEGTRITVELPVVARE
jgi:PAS domain S-box-containing protein